MINIKTHVEKNNRSIFFRFPPTASYGAREKYHDFGIFADTQKSVRFAEARKKSCVTTLEYQMMRDT